MSHPPAPTRSRPAGRCIPRTRLMITTLSGLAVSLTAAIGLAPVASATRVPAGSPVAPPPPPPPATAAAHFPLWAVVTIVAATIVVSVATTLVTLALDQMRRGRRIPLPPAEPQIGAPFSAITSEPGAEQGEVISSHHYAASHTMHQADGR